MRTFILCAAFIASVVVLAVLARLVLSPQNSLTEELLFSAAGRVGILTIGFAVIARWFPEELPALRIPQLRWSTTVVVCTGIVVLLTLLRLSDISLYPLPRVIAFASAMAAVAVLEEVVFRGMLFLHWLKSPTRRWSTISLGVLSSALFGVAHLINLVLVDGYSTPGIWTLVLYSFGVGLIMCGVTVKTDSILPAVCLHFAINFFMGTGRLDHSVLFQPAATKTPAPVDSISTLLLTMLLYSLLMIIGFLLLKSKTKMYH